MARRFRYGINCQSANAAKLFQLIPVYYLEVAPGETIQGAVQSRLWSDTTFKPVLNRAYFDTYAFYCPFRLLDENFPEFVKDRVGVLPTVTDVWPVNFEPALTLGADNTPANENVAWLRYMYNKVWNTFFREKDQPEVALDQSTLQVGNLRPSTWHESMKTVSNRSSEPIPSGTIDDLREAFASDRFDKLRTYYGNKYTDYLAALGVEASWSILDEPEMIGQKHADLPYKVTNATSQAETQPEDEQNIGDPGGYWDGVNTLSVKRTFCPEHGIIGVFAMAKMDTWARDGHILPILAKASPERYYSPEFSVESDDQWPPQLFDQTSESPQTAGPFQVKYADYQKGMNVLGDQHAGITDQGYISTYIAGAATEARYRRRDPNDYDSLFTGNLFDTPPGRHYQITSKMTFQKVSPIAKGRSQVY